MVAISQIRASAVVGYEITIPTLNVGKTWCVGQALNDYAAEVLVCLHRWSDATHVGELLALCGRLRKIAYKNVELTEAKKRRVMQKHELMLKVTAPHSEESDEMLLEVLMTIMSGTIVMWSRQCNDIVNTDGTAKVLSEGALKRAAHGEPNNDYVERMHAMRKMLVNMRPRMRIKGQEALMYAILNGERMFKWIDAMSPEDQHQLFARARERVKVKKKARDTEDTERAEVGARYDRMHNAHDPKPSNTVHAKKRAKTLQDAKEAATNFHETIILDVNTIEALRPRGGGKELDNQLRIWRQYQMKRPPGLVIWEAKKVMRKNLKGNDDKADALIQVIGMYQAKLNSLAS